MSRRGENIFKRKDGRWEARYIHHYENGKAKYGFVYGHTYGEAKAKKLAALSIAAPEKKPVPASHITLKQLSCMWLADVRISVKESTYTRYYRAVHKYIIPRLGTRAVDKIDSFVINSFTECLLSSGGLRGASLSAKTVSDLLCVIKSIIKFGKSNGYHFSNTDGIRFPQKNSKNIEILNTDKRTALEKILMDSDDTTSLGILFSLYTGIRIGELCGLQWKDIDYGARTVSICRTVERIADLDPSSSRKTKVIISESKTETSIRVIPLPSFLVEYLKKFDYHPGRYLITGRNTPIEPHCFYIRYKNFLKSHNIDEYTFHALRHTFATRCVEEGFDTKSLSEILGHSNISTTLAIYVHPSIEQKRAQMEKLNPCPYSPSNM